MSITFASKFFGTRVVLFGVDKYINKQLFPLKTLQWFKHVSLLPILSIQIPQNIFLLVEADSFHQNNMHSSHMNISHRGFVQNLECAI